MAALLGAFGAEPHRGATVGAAAHIVERGLVGRQDGADDRRSGGDWSASLN